MLKRVVFLFIVLLALTGCRAVATPTEDAFDVPVTVQASPVMVGSAAPTPSPTVRGTPTVDYQAKIGESDLKLHQSISSATMAAITQQVIDTAQAKLGIAQGKTGTAVVLKTKTFEAQSIQTQDAAATGTTQAPYNAREWVRTSWEPVIQAAYCMVILFIGAFICWAIYALAHAKYAMMVAQAGLTAAVKVPEIQPDERLSVQLDRRDKYGWGTVDWSTLPIDRATLTKVAELIAGGYHYTERQMTGSANPLTKDGTFDSFGDWMVKNYIATKIDGRYVILQRDFFEKVANA